MPPKPKGKDEKKKEEPAENQDEERELVEKELVIGYLRSKLGRCVGTRVGAGGAVHESTSHSHLAFVSR